ncbi:GDSL-type esterase/lipase family protein [Niameybacter massiliensis]|uniref:GDSL-type esterase/lipase family protein n=1 Tax=Holtiella tumoricola TaxID=3018743 RepID=A0AA42DN07_9FIRM|nr:GDSL-type esterase/lipase family protein [Holtiella tumoricola]MDA3731907.1 GDSL-type esterase/lipase family protein [Holtiella tumoricola]
MIKTKEGYDRLEYFSENVASDQRRKEFDIKNHTIIENKLTPTFLFIGDSITHFWELNAYFNHPDHLIINRGIAGDTTTYLQKRLWVDALQLHPTYCIVGIGINDSIDLEGDYWKLIPGLSYETVLNRAKNNIIDIASQFRASDTTPIFTSLLPINIPISLCEYLRKKYICEMNHFLYEYCKAENIIFVNYYPSTTLPGTNTQLYGITYDGLHPNARGYNIMATVLRNTLENHNIII